MNSNFMDVDGVATHYFDVGDGPAVVLIHGAALALESEFTWFRQIEALSKSWRVIAFDQPGFGRTEMPSGYMGRERRSAHAIAFLKKLGIRSAVLVGHSEGAYIALRIAIVAPDLASALVLVTSGSASPMLGGAADEGWMAASAALYRVGAVTETSYLDAMRGYALHWDERMERIARANIRRALEGGHVKLMQNMPPEELDMRAYMGEQERNIQPYLGNLRLPAMLIWSGNDDTVPVERGLTLMRAIPKADLLVLSGAKHNVMHDRRDAFEEALEAWIARIAPTQG